MNLNWSISFVITYIIVKTFGQMSCKIIKFDKKLFETFNSIPSASKPTVFESEDCSSQKICSNYFSLTLLSTTSRLLRYPAKFIMTHSFRVVASGKLDYPCGFSIQTRPGSSLSYCLFALTGEVNFECYKDVIPGRLYNISISSPFTANDIQSTYKVPECDYSNILDANVCANLTIQILNSCNNRSVEVNYEIELYSNLKANAALKICKKDGRISSCIPGSYLIEDLPLKGRINLTLPEYISKDEEYFVEMWYVSQRRASKGRKTQSLDDLLKLCFMKEDTGLPIHVVPVIIVFCIIFIVIGICIYKTKCNLDFLSERLSQDRKASSKEPEYLYLNYVNDHPKHDEIISKFTNFLAFEMGFRIKCEKYNRNELCSDPLWWMKTSLEEASKVLFVWSPGATRQWKMQSCGNSKKEMFSLILSKAIADIEMSSVKNRYYVIHFDYWDADIIPKRFRSKPFNYFSLVTDIEQFHCKLKKTIKSDKTLGCLSTDADPIPFVMSNSEFGNTLSQYINKMKEYVAEHPNWTKEEPLNSEITNKNPI